MNDRRETNDSGADANRPGPDNRHPDTPKRTEDHDTAPGVLAESDRVEGFSDGVLAIVITLLVLDLRAPERSGAMLDELLGQWPVYLAYLASFGYVGVIWVNHQLFTRVAAVHSGVLRRY